MNDLQEELFLVKKIKVYPNYGAGPVWVHDEKGILIAVDLPAEARGDEELTKLSYDISLMYESLFLNNEKTFEYIGFSCKEDEVILKSKIKRLHEILVEKVSDKYEIEVPSWVFEKWE